MGKLMMGASVLILLGLAGCCPVVMTRSPQLWTPDAVIVFADQLRPGDCIPFGVLNDLNIRLAVPDFEITARYVRRLLHQKAGEMEREHSFILKNDVRYDCMGEINGSSNAEDDPAVSAGRSQAVAR